MKYGLTISVLLFSFLVYPVGNEANAQTGTAVPAYIIAPDWPNIPSGMRLGTVSSVAVDDQDNVWILHRPRTIPSNESGIPFPAIVVFSPVGDFIKAWGGAGSGYEWPQNEHGIHIDNAGFVWVTGNSCSTLDEEQGSNSDDQILKFTQDGEFILQIGGAGQNTGSSDTLNVNRAADISLYPQSNELFVADGYGNRRVIVFDADTGIFKRQWGAFGEGPGSRSSCSFPAEDDWIPEQFSIVHSVRVSDDGFVYVADREHSRIQRFTLGGDFIDEFNGQGGRIGSLGFSPDDNQQFLYAGEEGQGILIINRQTMSLVSTVNPEGVDGPNHHMAVDSMNNIYRAGLFGGISKLEFSGMSD